LKLLVLVPAAMVGAKALLLLVVLVVLLEPRAHAGGVPASPGGAYVSCRIIDLRKQRK
jgi:hypothetical protein